jgi:ribose transport system substrate-binding protein
VKAKSRSKRIGVLCAGTALLFAACSSTHGEASTTSTTPSVTSGSGTAALATNSSLSALRSKLAALEQFPTSIGVTTPIPNPPRNKTAVWLEVEEGQGIPDEVTAPLKQAGALLNWKITVIPTQPTPQGVTTSMNTAVQLKPNVVFLAGFPPAAYQEQLNELKADGTVFIGYSLGLNQSPPAGFSWEGSTNAEAGNVNKLMADQIAVDANGAPAHVASFWLFTYQEEVNDANLFKTELSSTCPRCTLAEENVNATSIGTSLPQQIVAYLEAHPDTQYLVLGYAPMFTGVQQAVDAAGVGKSLKGALSFDGSETDWKDIAQSNGLETWDFSESASDLAYEMFDAALRVLSGMPTQQGVPLYGVPSVIVTRQNAAAWAQRDYVFIPNLAQQWEQLWGVS